MRHPGRCRCALAADGRILGAKGRDDAGTQESRLDKAAIYHKSAKGADAIATRNAALTPKLRSMLILINGRRPFDELAKLGQGLGDPGSLMAQLEAEGYIETGDLRAGPPTEPPPLFSTSGPMPIGPPSAPAPLGPLDLHVPLDQAQRHAVRKLNDLLGPTADDLCVRIESTRTAQEFRAAIRRTESVLRAVVGPELAAQFVSEVESQRP